MKFLKNIKKKIDFILFFYLRINRRPSNRLATIWLKKDLYKFRNLETALDVGCGKFLNKRHFINKNYIGIDLNEKYLIKGKKIYPNTKYYCASILNKLPVKGDLVVATLLLTTAEFPFEKTLLAVKNLADALNPSGNLIFTMGKNNYLYKKKIEDLLNIHFRKVTFKQYGNFNKPSLLGFIISFLMYLIPQIRTSKKNIMYYVLAENHN